MVLLVFPPLCNTRIVMSFETVASTYTRQIQPNTIVTIKTPFVTVTVENVSQLCSHKWLIIIFGVYKIYTIIL